MKKIMAVCLMFTLSFMTTSIDPVEQATAKSYSSPKAGSYWSGYKKVKLKRNVTIYKMRYGSSHARDYAVKKITLKKNSYVWMQSWCMSCGGTFVVKTSKYKPTKKYYYQTGYMSMKARFWY